MPDRKRKVPNPMNPNELVDGTVLGFQAGGEHWNEYLADDGSVIRIKLVVTDVVRVDDAYDQEGNPVYVVASTNILTVSAPDDLKKGGER